MCLITRQKSPRVAKKDITVYKAFLFTHHRKLLAPFQDFEYIPNKLYKTEMIADHNYKTYFDIEVCFYYDFNCYPHSYISEAFTHIHEGFHSFMDINRALKFKSDTTYRIFKCIIPKGSLYYKDGTGLIVSNAIIVTDVEIK